MSRAGFWRKANLMKVSWDDFEGVLMILRGMGIAFRRHLPKADHEQRKSEVALKDGNHEKT